MLRTQRTWLPMLGLLSGCMGLEPSNWTWPAAEESEPAPSEPSTPSILTSERLVIADTDADHLYVLDVGTWQVSAASTL